MTWATCVSYCDSKGYALAGVEYSQVSKSGISVDAADRL
jgi:hypothetical protein